MLTDISETRESGVFALEGAAKRHGEIYLYYLVLEGTGLSIYYSMDLDCGRT